MVDFDQFLDGDKDYQLILQRHRQVHGEVRMKAFEIMHEARKIKGLILATELLVEKLAEHEDVEPRDKDDVTLKRLTALDSDEWYGMIGETLNLIRDQIVEQCQQVVLAKHTHEKAKETASQHCDSLAAAREEAKSGSKRPPKSRGIQIGR